MNIFVLDLDPVIAARSQADKHVTKMVLESAQLLCSAFPAGAAPYRRTHYNHPCSVWTRASYDNFVWLIDHGMALGNEFHHRYGKHHASYEVLRWCWKNVGDADLPDIGLTPFAQAMPGEYKRTDPVEAYRGYYRGAKADIATWNKGRPAPSWWASVAV